MIKEKKCKGHGKARGFEGCEKRILSHYRVYGLCRLCLWEWSNTTQNGEEWFSKRLITVKKSNTSKQKKEARANDKKTRIEIMSNDKYRSVVLQPNINKIARFIDYGQPCIATGNYGKENGGHYIAVGANRTIALNLHNIHLQSFESNHFKGGDQLKYREGIIDRYGVNYIEFMEGLQACPAIHLSKQDLIDINKRALFIIKGLKANQINRNSEERIKLRNDLNVVLEVYNKEYSIYLQK